MAEQRTMESIAKRHRLLRARKDRELWGAMTAHTLKRYKKKSKQINNLESL